VELKIPVVDTNHLFVRPILGLDATHDPTPGNFEIKQIDYRLADPRV